MPLDNRETSHDRGRLTQLSNTILPKAVHTSSSTVQSKLSVSTSPNPRFRLYNRTPACLPATLSKSSSYMAVPSVYLESPREKTEVEGGAGSGFLSGLNVKLNDLLDTLHTVTTVEASADLVTLPYRYIRRSSDAQELSTSSCELADEEGGTVTREKDLSTALRWIRQEILQMKLQDQNLLQQFLELRANILQLKDLYDTHASCSDLSSLDGSTYSLNEQTKSPKLSRLKLAGNKPSVSLPSSPRVARFKWRGDET